MNLASALGPTARMPGRVAPVLGVPIDMLTMNQALDRICHLVTVGRATGETHQVATVNVDFLVNACSDGELLGILQRCDLAIADGMPVVWASRVLGRPLPERVARAADEGLSILLYGGALGVADRAADLLRRRHPGLQIEGLDAPHLSSVEEMPVEGLEAIRRARADVLCVALGHPKQDKWIAAYGRQLQTPVLIGVGGTLDFLTGVTRRAPLWMQRTGLEWVHRLAQQPNRLAKRYARDVIHFAPRVLWHLLNTPRGGPPRTSVFGTTYGELPPCLDTHDLTVDVTGLGRIDAAALHELVELATLVTRSGGRLRLTGADQHIQQTFHRLGLEGLLTFEPRRGGPVPSMTQIATAS
jgi:N-acetylglucosaminyldiphosphoundecaprenol N-acetyl-beta-D-mannosaminyltransferase